ncbi:thioesterase family protein [Lacisediminimonas profundi]|uniref:thioesterase family protein n=1 Tax=Lacisediminimonas profundi TaxID=2603856 RepID=UPI00124BA35A|nr:hotdog domain-containing protein [Lacisediminimonas profundi]
MKDSLKVGSTFTCSVLIDQERTIGFMGEGLRVYSTPSMVHDVEYACRDLLLEHHDSGEDSVGARVEIDHLAPTLLGQKVTISVTVAEIALPRLVFEVEVKDELDTVGRAKHVRFVVDTVKQAARLAKKQERLKAVTGEK